ncbi:Gfo/Idh/MocA family protein [Sanguibacter sp. Z1732]|uniref:Gfo/Idh/MocA family protein n=1 Tax=Sanguibacter sp. Z1732 TaxID=3435412 RepID=UPI003D9CB955
MVATTIGLLGAGRIGTLHAANLRALAEVEVLIADAEPARAQQVAVDLGCSAVADAEALFARDLDGVVIATGTDQHAPLVQRAAAAGAAVFCEKPLARTTAEALRCWRRSTRPGPRCRSVTNGAWIPDTRRPDGRTGRENWGGYTPSER